MDEIVIIAIRGIGLGAVFSVIAYAFNVTYNASAVMNLAQGHLLVLGGYVAADTVDRSTPVVTWLALALLAGVLIMVVTAVQGVVTLVGLRSAAEQWSWLVTTLAASVIIGALLLQTKGPHHAVVPNVLGDVRILGTSMPLTYLATTALSILCFAGLALFYRHTGTGLALSAMSQDFDAARATGVAVRRLQILAFGLSGLLLGVSGFVAANVLSLTPHSGLHYLVMGFIVAVVGGMGRDRGALVAGPFLGVVTMFAAYELGGQWENVAALAVLVVALMVRPKGLLGTSAVRAV